MSKAVYITQTSSFLPNSPIDNDNMEAVLGQAGPKPSRARRTILRSNGIKTRYYAMDPETREATHTNAQLAANAIQNLQSEQLKLAEISCLSCATTIPDQTMPNHAVMVHGELNLPAKEVVSTAGICMAGISALKYAAMAIKADEHDMAIACASERSSMSMRAENFSAEVDHLVEQLKARPEIAFEKDFLRWMLSDGAGAFLLEPKPNDDSLSLRIDWIELFSYANEMPACMYAGAIKQENDALLSWGDMPQSERNKQSVFSVKQDVKQLNDNIVHYTVERPLLALQEKYNIKPKDVDWYLPHYSSHFFRDKMNAGMEKVNFKIDDDRWFTNLYSKGNTGSASIYIMIDELFRSGKLKKDQKILCYVPESGRFSSSFMQLTVV